MATNKKHVYPEIRVGYLVDHGLLDSQVVMRAHTDDNRARSWMMRLKDIGGLTATQIRDSYAMPYLPKYMSVVNVPKGTYIRQGKWPLNPAGGMVTPGSTSCWIVLTYLLSVTREQSHDGTQISN